MGCCLSFASPDRRSPYPPHTDPSSSARAIASSASSPTLPRRPSTTGSAAPPSPPPPLQRRNKPLKRHVWHSERAWTRRELDREREEFFETRVAGRPEVWQSLRAALALLWDDGGGGGDAAAAEEALLTAQALLLAAEITVPSGDLAGQVYDRWGALYCLPEHVVSDPTNLRAEGEAGESAGGIEGPREASTESVRVLRREDKGKAVQRPESELVRVLVRLSDGRPDVWMKVGRDESMRSVQRRLLDDNGLPPDKKIKLIYMGRHLKDTSTLLAEAWSEGHVVNAFLCG